MLIAIFSIVLHYLIAILTGINKKRHISFKGVLKLLNKPVNAFIDKKGGKISETLDKVLLYSKIVLSLVLILAIASLICAVLTIVL